AQKVAARFRQLLRRHGLPEDLPVVALPDLAALGQTEALAAAVPEIGRSEERALPACAQGRMLLCRDDSIRVQACPLTDDSLRFEMGSSLLDAIAARVVPDHPRCRLCLGGGVDYAGRHAP